MCVQCAQRVVWCSPETQIIFSFFFAVMSVLFVKCTYGLHASSRAQTHGNARSSVAYLKRTGAHCCFHWSNTHAGIGGDLSWAASARRLPQLCVATQRYVRDRCNRKHAVGDVPVTRLSQCAGEHA